MDTDTRRDKRRGRMRGEINAEVKVWHDKEYTRGGKGQGVLNRFIGLKPGHHYSRLAFCRRPLCRGVRTAQ